VHPTLQMALTLLLVIDPVGNETQFVYDARSQQVREIDPLGNPNVAQRNTYFQMMQYNLQTLVKGQTQMQTQ